MIPGDLSLKVDIIDHVEDVTFVCSQVAALPSNKRKPIIVAHSFGGIIAMKMLEQKVEAL